MGGIVWGLAGMTVGLGAIIATVVITLIKMTKNKELLAISVTFIAASLGLLVLGATTMIRW